MKKDIIVCCSLFVFICAACGPSKQELAEKARQDSLLQDSIKKAEILAKVKQEMQAEHLEAVKNSIKITKAYLGSPNSVGGVEAYFYYKNISDKTIKYVRWYGKALNAVGDTVLCEVRHESLFGGKDTGPVKPGSMGGGCWDVLYNSTAKTLVITAVDIEFMDDDNTLYIDGDELQYIIKQ